MIFNNRDVVQEIFTYLNIKDVVALSAVNKICHNVSKLFLEPRTLSVYINTCDYPISVAAHTYKNNNNDVFNNYTEAYNYVREMEDERDSDDEEYFLHICWRTSLKNITRPRCSCFSHSYLPILQENTLCDIIYPSGPTRDRCSSAYLYYGYPKQKTTLDIVSVSPYIIHDPYEYCQCYQRENIMTCYLEADKVVYNGCKQFGRFEPDQPNRHRHDIRPRKTPSWPAPLYSYKPIIKNNI